MKDTIKPQLIQLAVEFSKSPPEFCPDVTDYFAIFQLSKEINVDTGAATWDDLALYARIDMASRRGHL